MPFFESLLGGFDQRRREVRAAESARMDQETDREFSILQALAQHPDPELAGLGTAGILELAGGRKPAKGLRGFLGEMERSSFYPQLRQGLLQGGPAQNAPARPGAGQLPQGSPVEPYRQASGPPTPAVGPLGGPPTMSMLPGGGEVDSSPPTLPPGMPEERLPAGPGPGGMAALLGMGGPPPPPPETPTARYNRLYPTAAMLRGEQVYQETKANLQAAFDAVRSTGGSVSPQLATQLVRGRLGTPERNTRAEGFNARYVGADGQERTGWVVFDPYNPEQPPTANGQPVQVLQELPNTQPRPTAVDVVGPDGTMQRQWVVPEAGMAVDRGVPPPAQPSDFTGGLTSAYDPTARQTVLVRPTRTGVAQVSGYQPPPTRTLQPNAEAVGMLRTVDQILVGMRKPRAPGMPAPQITQQQMDEVAQRASSGRWQTYAKLVEAASTRVPAQGAADAGELSMEDMAESVLRRLGGAGGGVGGPPAQPGMPRR